MKLPLAVHIADSVVEAIQAGTEMDVSERAHQLVADHPEANTSVAEVQEALEEELSANQTSRTVSKISGPSTILP